MHKITGMLLLYSRAIDLTLMVALGTIAAAQTIGEIETEKGIYKLLDYCATRPDNTLQYKASGMILKTYSDASY